MRLTNETLAKAAEIKAETMGRVFFNAGAHTLSYFFINGQHIVAHTMKFWKSGVLDSVGGRVTFNTESETLSFIQEKVNFYKTQIV